jgi:hypothetical protein
VAVSTTLVLTQSSCIDGDTMPPVYRWNHDKSYKGDLPDGIKLPDDGIEHVYFDRFEDLQKNLEKIIEEHGRKFGI